MEEDKKQAQVSYFVHEGALTRMQNIHDEAMKRMERVYRLTVIALVVALAITVSALVGNDIMWRRYCRALEERYQAIVEVQSDGVYQQSDPGSD